MKIIGTATDQLHVEMADNTQEDDCKKASNTESSSGRCNFYRPPRGLYEKLLQSNQNRISKSCENLPDLNDKLIETKSNLNTDTESLKKEIISLVKCFKTGIALNDFAIEYEIKYRKRLFLDKYGYHSLEQCIGSISELFFDQRYNNIYIVHRSVSSKVRNVEANTHTQCCISEVEEVARSVTGSIHLQVADDIQKTVCKKEALDENSFSSQQFGSSVGVHQLPHGYSEKFPHANRRTFLESSEAISDSSSKSVFKTDSISFTEEITSLVKCFDTGIALNDFSQEYEKKYHKCLSLEKYGYFLLEQCISSIAELRLEQRENNIYIAHRLMSSKPRNTEAVKEVQENSKFSSSEVNLHNHGKININLDDCKKNIRHIFISREKGCDLPEFTRAYRNLTGQGLPSKELGYYTDMQFLYSIPDVVKISRTNTNQFNLEVVDVNQKSACEGEASHAKSHSLVPCTPLRFSTHVRKSPRGRGKFLQSTKNALSNSSITVPGSNDKTSKIVLDTDRASFQDEITSLVKCFNSGIAVADFSLEYENRYHRPLSLDKYGYFTLEQCINSISELRLEERNRNIYVIDRSMSSKAKDVEANEEVVQGNFQSLTSNISLQNHGERSNCVDLEDCKRNVQHVLHSFKEGCSLPEFNRAYRNLTGQELPSEKLGYYTDMELLRSIPDTVTVSRSATGRFHLQIVRHSKDNELYELETSNTEPHVHKSLHGHYENFQLYQRRL